MADHPAGELRSFEDFSEAMTNFPYLRPIDEKRRKRLLRELYQAAVEKDVMGKWAKAFRDRLPEIRRTRRRILKTVGLLREMLQATQQVRASCNDVLAVCEEKSTTAGESFTFAVMEKNLNFSVALLEKTAAVCAALVHPKLRTNAEKRVGTKFLEAFGSSAAATAHNLPSSEKALVLDAWFIHKAAECIDRYKRPIEGKDIIIAKSFDAAFKEGRSQASVQKALKGRRKSELRYSPSMKIIRSRR